MEACLSPFLSPMRKRGYGTRRDRPGRAASVIIREEGVSEAKGHRCRRGIRFWGGAAFLAACLLIGRPAAATTLHEAVRMALDGNPSIGVAESAWQAASEELRAARAAWYPQVSLSAAFGREFSDNYHLRAAGERSGTSSWRSEAGFTVRQLLFDGYATSNAELAALREANTAAYQVQGERESIALATVEAYIEVLRTHALRSLAQQSVDTLTQRLSATDTSRQEGGDRPAQGKRPNVGQIKEVPALAVARLRNRLDADRARVLRLRERFYRAQVTYQQLTGEQPKRLTIPKVPVELIPAEMQAAINIAFVNNPRLQQAREAIEASQAQSEVAGGRMYPKVDFELGRNWNHNIDGLDGEDSDWSAMLRFNYDLFTGGRDTAKYKKSKHEIDQAVFRESVAKRLIEAQIRTSFNALMNLRRQLPLLEDRITQSRALAEAARKDYEQGKGTLADLLESEEVLQQARAAVTDGRYTEYYANYRVLAAMGVLVPTLLGATTQPATPYASSLEAGTAPSESASSGGGGQNSSGAGAESGGLFGASNPSGYSGRLQPPPIETGR